MNVLHIHGDWKNWHMMLDCRDRYWPSVSCILSDNLRCNTYRNGGCKSHQGCSPADRAKSRKSPPNPATTPKLPSAAPSRNSWESPPLSGANRRPQPRDRHLYLRNTIIIVLLESCRIQK